MYETYKNYIAIDVNNKQKIFSIQDEIDRIESKRISPEIFVEKVKKTVEKHLIELLANLSE